MSRCFGNIQQRYAMRQPFSCGGEYSARECRAYRGRMAHRRRARPGKSVRVQHADSVGARAGNRRRSVAVCGLALESARVLAPAPLRYTRGRGRRVSPRSDPPTGPAPGTREAA